MAACMSHEVAATGKLCRPCLLLLEEHQRGGHLLPPPPPGGRDRGGGLWGEVLLAGVPGCRSLLPSGAARLPQGEPRLQEGPLHGKDPGTSTTPSLEDPARVVEAPLPRIPARKTIGSASSTHSPRMRFSGRCCRAMVSKTSGAYRIKGEGILFQQLLYAQEQWQGVSCQHRYYRCHGLFIPE
mmetsp:Transcript_26087/g.73059  ORF Transcript_26087/g.73059 Transcript_26087/m.73059 type:complete len:183 (+) Transcript_26087:1129-1677(+)